MGAKQHDLIVASTIMEALEEWVAAESALEGEPVEGVIVDFVCGYTVQKIDGDDDLTWQNAWVAQPGQGPNTHAGLVEWLHDRMNVASLEADAD